MKYTSTYCTINYSRMYCTILYYTSLNYSCTIRHLHISTCLYSSLHWPRARTRLYWFPLNSVRIRGSSRQPHLNPSNFSLFFQIRFRLTIKHLRNRTGNWNTVIHCTVLLYTEVYQAALHFSAFNQPCSALPYTG